MTSETTPTTAVSESVKSKALGSGLDLSWRITALSEIEPKQFHCLHLLWDHECSLTRRSRNLGRLSHQECATTLRMASACDHRTRVCRTNSPGSLQTQFLHTRCERAGLDCKQLRGSPAAVHFPPCFVQ